jgi:gluconokinase
MTSSVVIMGVAGCGKSSVGAALARACGLPFIEGDDYHAPSSRDKMHRGIALDDADREGWLAALGEVLRAHPGGAVLTCSALKRAYRDRLRAAAPGLRFVFLDLELRDARKRVAARPSHFFSASLVDSQYATLESPVGEPGVLRLDAQRPVDDLASQAADWLKGGQ